MGVQQGDIMTQSLTELHLLAQLDHPHIVKVYGLVIDRSVHSTHAKDDI
jgi:serine/threonine protein kinase